MYVEERIYRLEPGRVGDYFALYESKGMAAQRKYIKVMLGYYAAEIGDLNEVVHLWGHDSLDARASNRELMRADPEFQLYWAEARRLIVSQRTRIMVPAPFFKEQLARMAAVSTNTNEGRR